MNDTLSPCLLAVSAYSGAGKTTLLTTVIPLLKAKGLRLGVIKHTHHDMDIDHPGKDSYELRKAGADQTLVASNVRWALMTETPDRDEVNLREMVNKMDCGRLDLVLVEGFRHEKVPKIVVTRHELRPHSNDLMDEYVIALVSDRAMDSSGLPSLNINQPQEVADFIAQWVHQQHRTE